MADNTTELEVLNQIVDVLGGQSGQYETVVPVLQQIKELLAAGITDPEAIAEAVAAWLDEHPEATTTVQDGSITGVKIADDTIPDVKLAQTGGVLSDVGLLDASADVKTLTLQYTDGYFISASNSTKVSSANFKLSSPMQLYAGTVVKVYAKGYQNQVAIIAKSNNDGTKFKSLVASDGSDEHWYSFTVETSGLYVVSSNKSVDVVVMTGISLVRTNETLSQATSMLGLSEIDSLTYTDGKYINAVNSSVASSAGFELSSTFEVSAGSTVFVKAAGHLTYVAIIARANESATAYQSLVASDGGDYKWYSYTADESCFLCVSGASTLGNEPQVYVVSRGGTSGLGTGPLAKVIRDGGFTALFHNLGCIGDSLTSGVSNYPTGSTFGEVANAAYSWPQALAREVGVTAYNFSRGGCTTRLWLNNYQTAGWLNDDFTSHKCEGYVIALGVNDYHYYTIGSEYGVPLGTSADVNLSDPTQNADTFYGNYARIISVVKGVQPHAKVFVVTDPKNDNYNEAIRWMAANITDVYLIDLYAYGQQLYASLWNDGASRVNSHLTAYGYLQASWHIGTYIDYIVRNNAEEFKYVQFIGTEYYPS